VFSNRSLPVSLTEGDVAYAVQLWIGRQLCDECDMTEDQARAFIRENEIELEYAMSEAVQRYVSDVRPEEDE
jgi:hypothetical protein